MLAGVLCLVGVLVLMSTSPGLSALAVAGVLLGGVLLGRGAVLTPRQDAELVLREIIDTIPHRVFWKDRDGVYLGCNTRFARDAGRASCAEIIGRTDYAFFPDEEADFYRKCDQESMAAGVALHDIEEPQSREGGEVAWVLTSKVPLRDPRGEVIGILGTYVDITARKRTEEALRAARQQAEVASAAKSRFLANTSHELRTLLNGVLGMLELTMGEPLEAPARQRLTIARSSATMLLDILNDVLDLTRLESDRLPVRVEPFSLEKLLAELLHSMKPGAQERGLSLTCALDSPVPARLTGDARRLRQCLTNLVGNSLKFTEQGGIRVSASVRGEALILAVRDTGIGISEDALPTLFDSFAQAHGQRSVDAGGVGLGLAICDRLVSAMSGSLTVESQVGEGTVFEIALPLAWDQERDGVLTALELDPSLLEQPPVAGVSFTGRVLMVEDNAINRLVLRGHLERLGLEVSEAPDGAAALTQLGAGPLPDLVITDMHMPQMGGLALLREIRARQLSVPVVVCSASVMQADIQACVDAGSSHHLAKPIQSAQLLAVLSELLPPAEGPLPQAG